MADMTVGELRELLELLEDDTPIRMGYQPSYPLQAHIQPNIRMYRGAAYILEDAQVYDRPYLPRWLLNGDYEPCGVCASSLREMAVSIIDHGEQYSVCQVCFESMTEEDRAEVIITPTIEREIPR